MLGVSVKNSPTKTTYTEGETLNPTGLVLTAVYDNETTEEIVYSEETANAFVFNPTTNTPLTTDHKMVTVTYGKFETSFVINVTKPEKPDPEKPDPEKPDPENPDPEKPNPENPGSGNQGSGKPDANGGSTGNTNNSNNAVQTGDNTSAGMWVIALGAACVAGAATIIFKRRNMK